MSLNKVTIITEKYEKNFKVKKLGKLLYYLYYFMVEM